MEALVGAAQVNKFYAVTSTRKEPVMADGSGVQIVLVAWESHGRTRH